MRQKSVVERVHNYTGDKDWRVKENSNTFKSFPNLQGYLVNGDMTEYGLEEVYTGEMSQAHNDCILHLHDMSHPTVGYCSGWSTKQIVREGFNCGPIHVHSTPPHHLRSLFGQINNFIFTMSGEWAGAQALNSLDTYCAAYIKYDKMSYKEVYKEIRSLVFNLNVKTRIAMQSPFTNVSLDLTVPDDLKYEKAYVGDIECDFTYGDCQEEMNIFNMAFCDVMLEGDALHNIFPFPIPTYGITNNFPWDSELAEKIFTYADESNSPYFSNFINSDIDQSDVRSMCITPDSLIRIKEVSNGCIHVMPIKEVFDKYSQNEYLILTRYGYKPVKEEFELRYQGDMLKVTTESGATLTTTLDHPWRVYYDNLHSMYEKKASELSVGDYVSLRSESALTKYNKSKAGKSYEEFYGEEKGSKMREERSEISKRVSIFNTDKNPAINMLQSQKDSISRGLQGHYVSDNCRQKSSERWQEINNPVFNQEYWDRNHRNSAITSKLELKFAEELEGLGLEYVHQYVVEDHIVDFYIPSKNLIVELESDYKGCSFNEQHNWNWHHGVSGEDRLKCLRSHGYDVLIFNPTDDSDEYRQYINKVDKIVSIEIVPYDGYVYDVEIDTNGTYINSHTFYANDILTGNCCRLRLDLRELEKSSGGLFGSGDSTGSIGVVTLNLSRIGYMARVLADFHGKPDQIWSRKSVIRSEYQTEENIEIHTGPEVDRILKILEHYPELFARVNVELRKKSENTKIVLYTMMISYFMDIGRKALLVKRQEVQESMDSGMIPYTKRYLGTFDNHFNTLGVNAGHEMCLNMLDKGIETEDGKNLAEYTLQFMLDRLSDYQEEDQGKLLWNLEATPAEGTSTRFAKGDRKDFKGIVTGGGSNMEFYTNSTQLPDYYTDNIFEAFDHQESLQTKYTSGTVQHIYMNEPVHDWRVIQSLVKNLFTNYKLPYISISPTITVCPICGKLIHNTEWCDGPHDPKKVKELIKLGILSKDEVIWEDDEPED